MTKQEREILNSIDYDQLVEDCKKHNGIQNPSISQVYKYYMTLPDHLEVSYNTWYGYMKKNTEITKYYPEAKEPYTGTNQTILYYLELLSTKR